MKRKKINLVIEVEVIEKDNGDQEILLPEFKEKENLIIS